MSFRPNPFHAKYFLNVYNMSFMYLNKILFKPTLIIPVFRFIYLYFNSSHREVNKDSVEKPKPVSFLDHAKFRFGGSYHDHSVDDIKKVGKILLVFTALIPYWMVYFQVCIPWVFAYKLECVSGVEWSWGRGIQIQI